MPMAREFLTRLPRFDLVVEEVSASDIMPGSSSGRRAEGPFRLPPELEDMPDGIFTLFSEFLVLCPLEPEEL